MLAQPVTRTPAEAIEADHNACRFNPEMVPVMLNGVHYAASRDVLPKPRASLIVADYVGGMELLGWRFWIVPHEDGTEHLVQPSGYHTLPRAWIFRAKALRKVFPAKRDAEVIAFLKSERATVAAEKTPTADRSLSDAEWAATEFEPWTKEAGDWEPPTNAEWIELAKPVLVTVRIAWLTMFKTKAEIIEFLRPLPDEYGEELKDGFLASIDLTRNMLTVLEAAEARIISAGYALRISEDVSEDK